MYRYDVARNNEEKTEVLSLIKRVYARENYAAEDAIETAFDKHLLAPETRVFAAYRDDVLFATVSVVPDSDLGLPMDILYKQELNEIRSQNKKIAEVGQFAVDHKLVQQLTASAPLLKLVLEYAIQKSLDYLCIAINPKHDSFYKALGFVPIGGLKYYPSVNNAPALARVLNIKDLGEKKVLGIFR